MVWDTENRPAHDPYVDVYSFMHCADRVVSYGFPRPGDPGNTRYIVQYHGTDRRGDVVVNDATGDIATIYTEPNNDWRECTFWQPASAQKDTLEDKQWRMTYPASNETEGSTAADSAAA
ncbi:hypothetical protein SAMN04487905_1192 [Actinopolyspora xinjiangensis]|uniref:Uncharacterized protein n=1 Tax=Actinopolyspora xinjiangensis TaxID=405564 RepID=A0A1H0WZ44_9ACTN|nr:hypothetical protein SAMN04487905_1192 [Actinopolyspora xinjiangensis]